MTLKSLFLFSIFDEHDVPLNMELTSFITCHACANRSLYIVQYKNVRVCVSDQMIFVLFKKNLLRSKRLRLNLGQIFFFPFVLICQSVEFFCVFCIGSAGLSEILNDMRSDFFTYHFFKKLNGTCL